MASTRCRTAAGLGWGILLVGCGSTSMTPTDASTPARPRGPQCEFQVLSAPAEGFTEVGVIDVKSGAFNTHIFTDTADFKAEIRPYVCQAGGDAALVVVDGFGTYIKATVLRRVANAASPAPAGSNAAQNEGCKYDTQCKGDRICVAGGCQAPATPPAAPAPAAPPLAPAAR